MRLKNDWLVVVISAIVLFALQPVSAQDSFSFEVRSGLNLPTQELGGAKLGMGFGFEGTVAYRFMPHLSVYTGWGWNKFSSDESFAGSDVDIEETGYLFGLLFNHPLGDSLHNYFVQAGGVYKHIEVESGSGGSIADSGHGLGWNVAVGLDLSFCDDWRLRPGIRYQSLTRDIKVGAVTTDVTLDYLSLGLAVYTTF